MRILIADDSPVLRMAVSKLLEAEGFEVTTATDGIEAITSVYENPPNLILLDVKMPRLTGYVACRLLKEDPFTSHIPVLILTSLDSTEDRYWGRSSGADGFITKDTLGSGLVNAINSALATRALSDLTSERVIQESPSMGAADVLTRVCDMLDRKLFEMTVVTSVTEIAMEPLQLQVMLKRMLEAIGRVVAFDLGAVVMVRDRRTHYMANGKVGQDGLIRLTQIVTQEVARFSGNEPSEGSIRLTELGQTSEREAEGEKIESVYAVPLRARGTLLGVLVLTSTTPSAFTDQVLRTLRTLVPAASGVVDAAQMFQSVASREARSNLSALSAM